MAQKTEISKKWLQEQYWGRGLSTRQIAEMTIYGRSTIINRMIEYGIRRRNGRNEVDITADWLEEKYWDEGMSIAQIANLLGCSNSKVRQWMIAHGIERRSTHQAMLTHNGYEITADWLEEKYWDEGMSTGEIAELVGCSPSTVLNRMRRYGIERRNGGSEGQRWVCNKRSEKDRCRCSRCDCYGWEKSPILDNGMCLWCQLEVEGVDLTWWAENVGWGGIGIKD